MLNKVKSFGREVKSFMTFMIFPVIAGAITFVVVWILQAIVTAIFRKVTS